MKHLRGTLGLVLGLALTPAMAQTNQGSSPYSVTKGGTGRMALDANKLIFGNGASPVQLYGCTGFLVGTGTGSAPTCRIIAGTDLPLPGASSLGGAFSKAATSSQWLRSLGVDGAFTASQPAFADISGTAALSQIPAFSGLSAASAAADADTFPTNQGAGNLKQTLGAIKTWIKAWIVKADVGLGNVDNTSNATERAAARTLTNAAISGAANTITNLATSMFAANVIDTDTTLTANSDTRIASQKAVKAYVDAGGGGGGGYPDEARRNQLLLTIYQSKSFAEYRRLVNLFATGFKAASGAPGDILNGILTASSSNYVVTPGTAGAATGNVAPSVTAGSNQVPLMTANTTSGVTISADTEFSGSFMAYLAGNRAAGDFWSSVTAAFPHWLKWDLGSAKTIATYTIQCRADQITTAASAWTLQGSATGSFAGEQVTLDTQSGQTWTNGQIKSFNIASPTSYRYYRLHVTAGADVSGTLQIAEVTLLTASVTNNMTLVTVMQTADSSVSNGRVLLEFDNTASPALNSDLTVEVTCNGGTNWSAATLSLVTANSQGGRSVAETADTACTSGTSFAARIKTLNNKNVPIYGASLTVH